MGIFEQYVTEYLDRGIDAFPIGGGSGKTPLIRGWNKRNIPRSRALANHEKFKDANIGFKCGVENGITIVDIDEAGPGPFDRMIKRCGKPAIAVQTASGKHHLYYKHAGEARRINCIDGEKVDILGNGVAVAPPSERPDLDGSAYKFVIGSLDDISALTPIKLGSIPDDSYGRSGAQIKQGMRNNTLFSRARIKAKVCKSEAEVIEMVADLNNQLSPPLPNSEVMGVARSIQKMKDENRLWGAGEVHVVSTAKEIEDLKENISAYFLLNFLRSKHGWRDEDFILANAITESLGWTLLRFRNAKNELIDKGYLYVTNVGGRHKGDPPRVMLLK